MCWPAVSTRACRSSQLLKGLAEKGIILRGSPTIGINKMGIAFNKKKGEK